MHRINVDLPDPEGPITTTTSCSPTRKLMLCNAWKVPKNLDTFCTSIEGFRALISVASANTSFSLIVLQPPSVFLSDGFLETLCTTQPSRSAQRMAASPTPAPSRRSRAEH